MAVVDIIIPAFRGIVPTANTALLRMIQASQCRCGNHEPWECTRSKHSIYVHPHVQSSVIHWARNHQVAEALYKPQPDRNRPPAEYILMLDDDMCVEPFYLDRLLMHRVDIVAGICTKRRDPPTPTIQFWDPKDECFRWPAEWDWDSQKLMECDAAGAACLLVRRRVLERMTEAYLDCFFERLEHKARLPSGTLRYGA